jgi:pimeloyl-ACP methyl ester carboxylesterase
MNERTRTVEVDGQEILVHEWGEPDAPAVLFLHGAGDTGCQASPLAAVLEDAFLLVAPDVPGHGRSPPADPGSYVPSRMVSLLVGLLDEAAIGAAALVGFSWGASIACHLAARHPDRARSLALLEGGHVDFEDVSDFDPAAIPAGADAGTAMMRGLVRQPVTSTYSALRQHSVPVLLVTALRDDALGQLRLDPLARLERGVPQARIARLPGRHHDLLGHDDGTVAGLVRDWLVAH